ncbi:unnamed protein product, partial [Laminaria digitata]
MCCNVTTGQRCSSCSYETCPMWVVVSYPTLSVNIRTVFVLILIPKQSLHLRTYWYRAAVCRVCCGKCKCHRTLIHAQHAASFGIPPLPYHGMYNTEESTPPLDSTP